MPRQPRALFINVNSGVGSTGRICLEQALRYQREGWEVRVAYGRDQRVEKDFAPYLYKIDAPLNLQIHVAVTRLFDAHGFASVRATNKLIRWAQEFNPDVLCLHNIHGYYLNVKILFDWIKIRPWMKVYWTLHDAWSFTGHCACFNAVQCYKWKTSCHHCIQKKEYPSSLLVDGSTRNYERKKAAFTRVKNMTLITPSEWMAKQVAQSFMHKYRVEVHYNSIDTNAFRPGVGNSRNEHGLEAKKVLLGVANVWQECKGLYDILFLRQLLDDRYTVMLVGLTEKQIRDLSSEKSVRKILNGYRPPRQPESYTEVSRTESGTAIQPNVWTLYEAITGMRYREKPGDPADLLLLGKIGSKEELAAIYRTADIFINPTHEDNYPTVNLEAQACGTFVITYDTGGARETLNKGAKNI